MAEKLDPRRCKKDDRVSVATDCVETNDMKKKRRDKKLKKQKPKKSRK
jgi:hypothetical protein